MAHALFDVYPEATQGAVNLNVALDDEDVLQCGKCKKQFSSLVSFISHKREPCKSDLNAENIVARSDDDDVVHSSSSATNILYGANEGQTLYTSVSSSSLSQLTESVVLNEAEFLSLTGIEPSTLSFPVTHVSNNDQVDACISSSSLQQSLTTVGATLCPTRFANQTTVFTMAQMKASPTSLYAKTVTPICATDLDRCQGQFSSSKGATTLSLAPNALLSIGDGIPAVEMKNIGNTVTYNIVAELQPMSEGDVGVEDVQKDADENDCSLRETLKGKKRNTIKGNAISDSIGKKAVKLQCIYCYKGFTKNFDLQQHLRSHTGEKPFQCIVCGRAFAQKSNVKKHMQTHKVWPGDLSRTLPDQRTESLDESAPPTSCADPGDPIDKCHETVITSSANSQTDQMNDGSKTTSDGQLKVVIDNSYVCQYCNEIFKTYLRLKTHLKTHKNEQVYKCIMKACGQTFHELDTFLEHTKTHENEMIYRCHVCNKTFASLYDLGVHQYTHSVYSNEIVKPGTRYYRCTKCLNKYATPEALDHHMTTTTHSYLCPLCDKVFTCERYLRRHLPTHGSTELHSCPDCHKRFKTEHYLKIHRLIHSGEKPFCCTQCKASFNRKDKLKRHLLIHNPVKHYKCPFRNYDGCTKEFHRPDKLKAHILTHSGLKPYKCRYCGKTFSRPSHLRKHEQLHTQQELTLSCVVCKKHFTTEEHLFDHACDSTPMKDSRKRAKSKIAKRGRVAKKLCSGLVGGNESTGILQQKSSTERKTGVKSSMRLQRLQRNILLNSVSSKQQQQQQELLECVAKANVDHTNSETCFQSSNFVTGDQLERRSLDSATDLLEVYVSADNMSRMEDPNHVLGKGEQHETMCSRSVSAVGNCEPNKMAVDNMSSLETTLQPLDAVVPMHSVRTESLTLEENEVPLSQVTMLPCDLLLHCQPVIVAITAANESDRVLSSDNNEINS